MQVIEHKTFVRNQWYAAALAREISRKPAQFWLLDEPLVLYRKQDHEAVAMRDMCPHRHAPLSFGIVIGDEIQCPYHGSGRCTKIPGQEKIPNAMRVDVFPCVEYLGFIWVWPGDPAKADKSLLPHFPWPETEGFVSVHFSGHYDAPWEMLLDNLMDMTHVPFVHGALLGAGNAVHEDPMRTWEEGGRVLYRRDVKRSNFGGAAGSALASNAAAEDVYALLALITDGHVANVGLDVFRGEPQIDPRWLELPEAVLLPHIGSATELARVDMGLAALHALERHFEGVRPMTCLNPSVYECAAVHPTTPTDR